MSAAWVDRLKTKWGIESNFQVFMICVVFSLAGMSISLVRPIAWNLFGFTKETSYWIKVPTYIALIFPTYQVMLMVFGTLLGQFKFFWAKEKAMLMFFARPFRKK
jgi:hypothetical protein